MAMTVDEYGRLPGAEVIGAGLRDLAAGDETPPALAVLMTATRLRALGLDVPDSQVRHPSHRLYELLAHEDARTAHGRYNAIVRRIVSFARAAEHARAS